MFRHVVVFTFTPETTQEQQEELATQLRTLPGAIGEITDYHVGQDAGLNPGSYQFAVVADFARRGGLPGLPRPPGAPGDHREHPADRGQPRGRPVRLYGRAVARPSGNADHRGV